jgi:hypothetical protein
MRSRPPQWLSLKTATRRAWRRSSFPLRQSGWGSPLASPPFRGEATTRVGGQGDTCLLGLPMYISHIRMYTTLDGAADISCSVADDSFSSAKPCDLIAARSLKNVNMALELRHR